MTTAQRFVAVLLSLAALVFTPRAFATSCEVPQLKSSTERADVVFVGVVGTETQTGGGMGNFRVRVDRVFKGSVPATLVVSGGGMKGASFTIGQRYLVFGRLPEPAAPRPPDLFAHLCGGTQAAEHAAEWIAALGAGTAPTAAGTAIVAGAPADMPPAPPAPPAPAPPAPQSDVPAEPPPQQSAAVQQASPDPSHAATTPPTGGGCAGCTSSGSPVIAPTASMLAFALPLLLRRRSRFRRG